MKKLLGVLLIIIGVVGGIYVGGFVMFVQPILDVCKAIDTKTLTCTVVGVAILKCIFASFIGYLIATAGVMVGCILTTGSTYKKRKRKHIR